jgi:hypothetical protein
MTFWLFIYHSKALFNSAGRHFGGLLAFSSVKAGLAVAFIMALLFTPALSGGADAWDAAPCAGANKTVTEGTQIQSGPGVFSMPNSVFAGTGVLIQSGSVALKPRPFTSVL